MDVSLRNGERLNKNKLILALLVSGALVALGLYAQHKYSFNWHEVMVQFTQARWNLIAYSFGGICLAYAFRAVRWAYLLRHNKKVPALSLLGTQVIGFTAVALIGRVADPVRPYLVSKKTGLPLSNQIAVYIVERLFDFGTMALFFSVALLTVSPGAMPHAQVGGDTGHTGFLSHLLQRVPSFAPIMARFGGLILTAIAALFLVAVRFAGETVASLMGRLFGLVSTNLGHAVADKIRTFRTGLDTMRSPTDFAVTLGLSVAMWALITLSYLGTIHAFPASLQLRAMPYSKCVILMMISGGASVFQLPVLGWFTQTFAVAAVLSAGFGVAKEPATACAAMILVVTFLGIVPVGLAWAHADHVSLRKITAESEHAEHELEAAEAVELESPRL
jgi:glycosyltransferase 2 family protein